MGLLSQIFESRGATRTLTLAEVRNLSLTNIQEWIDQGIVQPTATGIHVTADNALKYGAVFKAVRVLSETLASLPLVLYERLERGKRRATDHYLYQILHDAPNPLQTAYEFRVDMMVSLNLWGNAYCQIEYDGAGRVMELWPLRPDRMMDVTRVQGRMAYKYQLLDGREEWIAGERIWHLRTFGSNGVTGLSPIQLHRQGIGLGLATEKYGASFFGNGAIPGGVVEHPGVLGKEAHETLRDSWEEAHQGLNRAHRVAILEEGMKYHQIGIPPEDAQYLETRTFQAREIASIYRVPPHMMGDLERATFSNIEQQSIEFVSYTMLPWLVNWEQSIQQRLMLARDRKRYFAEFLTAALERGDISSRYEAYAQGRQNGWLSANDIRELENLNPIEGGDVYLVPLNMVPADQVGRPDPDQQVKRDVLKMAPARMRALPATVERRADEAAAGRLQLAADHMPLFRDVMARTVRREVADIRREAQKRMKKADLAGFLLWLERFYEEHGQFVARALDPAYLAYAAAVVRAVQAELDTDDEVPASRLRNFLTEYSNLYGVRYGAKQRKELVRLIERTEADEDLELLPAIEERLDSWDEARPEQESRRELLRSNNAIALLAYAVLGVTIKRWNASGDSCDFCQKLHGKKVEINGWFVPKGSSVEVDGQAPMRVDVNLGHPPVHDGCDCMVVGG